MVGLRTHFISILVAALSSAFALTVSGCDRTLGAASDKSDKNSFTVASPLTSLAIDNPVGSTRIEGTEADTVSVTEELRYTGDPPRTSHEVSGGQLTLTYTCPSQTITVGKDSCSVNYVVKAPRHLAVRVDDQVGGTTLSGLAGTLTVTSSTGSIDAIDLTSRAVTTRASTGAINLAFATPPTAVDAQAQVGSVTLRLPAETAYSVDASSQVGKAEVTVRQDAGSGNRVRAHSQVGSVTVTNN